MSESKYLTAPVSSTEMPKGIPYIIGNEAAERFSFYGMKTILFVFMTTYLLNSDGVVDPMSESEASVWYHMFTFAVYLTPLLGAIIADVFLGKYLTIIALSLVYCAGHLVLALDETRQGLALGLGLIAVGAGGIKPCVSAHVGDQFGKSNSHLLEKVFGWFYFSINLGAGASSIATPWLLEAYGPQVAFGVPGGLMLLATWVFWLGRREFIHIPPRGKEFLKEVFSPLGLRVMFKLCLIYLFVLMFWALFDQTGSRWVQQAGLMDRHFLGVEWLPSQIQVMNPILIMAFIPLFAFYVYPAINRIFPLSPLRKIGIGFFITTIAFLIPAWIEVQIEAGEHPNIVWQLLAYAVLTAAEVMISITALEFSYTQAPKVMKSWIMGLFLASVALGNLFTAMVNAVILDDPPSFVPDVAGEYTLQVRVSDGQSHHNAQVTYTAYDGELPTPAEDTTARSAEEAPATEAAEVEAPATEAAEVEAPAADAAEAAEEAPTTDAAEATEEAPTTDAADAAEEAPTADATEEPSNENNVESLVENELQAFRVLPPGKDVYLNGSSAMVTLKEGDDGSITRDVKGKNPIWTFLAVPEGSSVTEDSLVHGSSKTPRFTPDVEGIYVVNLNLSKRGFEADYQAMVEISTENHPPQASAGSGENVLTGSTVALNASSSYDANGDDLTYEWTLVSTPNGSSASTASIVKADKPTKVAKLSGPSYYLFFAGCMFVWAILYIPVAMWFKEETFIQDEETA
ncbi:MAG: MFS transporter [Myxococcota bacterium]|nr:MFS transporter [Myxococcota bacterium]